MSTGQHVKMPRVEAPKTLEIGVVVKSVRCFPPQLTRSLGKLSQWDPGRAPAAKSFWQISSCENVSDSSSFHHFCVGKKY